MDLEDTSLVTLGAGTQISDVPKLPERKEGSHVF